MFAEAGGCVQQDVVIIRGKFRDYPGEDAQVGVQEIAQGKTAWKDVQRFLIDRDTLDRAADVLPPVFFKHVRGVQNSFAFCR